MNLREDSVSTYFRLFNEIGIIAQLSGNKLERVLPDGMSLAQFSVLNHFCRLGGASSPTRLASAFQVTKGAMTNTLQRLEAQGFVTARADDEDARAKVIEITEAGRSAREAAIRATGPIVMELAGLLPMADVKAALPFLEALRKTLDENR
jgi:DNA-binding MarR family transcriptional regulator